MPSMKKLFATLLCLAGPALAQDRRQPPPPPVPDRPANVTRVATYNIENWRYSFLAHKVWPTSQPSWSEDLIDLVGRERREDDEENWEVSRTILHPDFLPDILVVQEACDLRDLNYFNTQFLRGYFETVHVFASNSGRGQNIGILLRPGYKVLEFREDFHKHPDDKDVNPESDFLFARGPAFALVQTPGGAKLWVGTNHAKSKGGNNLAVTRWRNEEAVVTHQIIQDIRKAGPATVVFLGDLNDELGIQEFELDAGGSAIELLTGTGKNALVVATKPLADAGRLSYHGGMRGRYKSFIDHAVLSPEAMRHVKKVDVFDQDLAGVASDHYPVYLDLALPAPGAEGP